MDPLNELIASLAKLEFGGKTSMEEKDEDITKQLANHYLALIKTVKQNYTAVSLDKNSLFSITVDQAHYDLDLLISHDDLANKKHRLAIESVLSELAEDGEDINEILSEVETILNNL